MTLYLKQVILTISQVGILETKNIVIEIKRLDSKLTTGEKKLSELQDRRQEKNHQEYNNCKSNMGSMKQKLKHSGQKVKLAYMSSKNYKKGEQIEWQYPNS